MLPFGITCLLLGGCWAVMRHAAQRFAAEQQRLGRWDAEGPLVETAPPPHRVAGGNMDGRLEVAGLWQGRTVRDRRPYEDAAPVRETPAEGARPRRVPKG